MSNPLNSTCNASSRIQELGAKLLADVDTTLESTARPGIPELLSQLDADISYLEEYVAIQMRRRRNLRVVFLCLPAEVIEKIAVTLADSWPPCMPETKPIQMGWMNFVRVCSPLRSLLINHSQLWAADAFTLPDARFCELMISRARNFPLSAKLVDAGVPRKGLSTAIYLVREHFASISTVNVSNSNAHTTYRSPKPSLWPFTCGELSGVELPRLISMDISTAQPEWRLATPDRYTCPPMLTPNLRRLTLTNAHVPFDPSTLTELSLSTGVRDHDIPAWIPPAAYFLDILRKSSHLRVLRLRATIPELEEEVSHLPISLPQLEMLSMQGLAHSCLTLWSLLLIPPHTTIRLHLHQLEDTPLTDPMEQLTCLRGIGASITDACFTYDHDLVLYLFTPKPDGYGPSKYTGTVTKLPVDFKDELLRLELELEGISPLTSSAASILSSCATTMALDSIRNLHIENNQKYDPQEWGSMLEPFRGVQTLDVSAWEEQLGYAKSKRRTRVDHAGLVQALLDNKDNVLPFLQDLRLQAVQISTGCTTDMLFALARSRSLRRISVNLLVFSRDYTLCDAERWGAERQPFMDRLESLGTHAEGFVEERNDSLLNDKQREARERFLFWKQRLIADSDDGGDPHEGAVGPA
ncbi:hypothetical protein PENSPDRAFT_750362 [Peniophora sp. CONT]|nr:hypothetical protein PENSPDRAFT_750362 [Peniophora sp. CONT]